MNARSAIHRGVIAFFTYVYALRKLTSGAHWRLILCPFCALHMYKAFQLFPLHLPSALAQLNFFFSVLTSFEDTQVNNSYCSYSVNLHWVGRGSVTRWLGPSSSTILADALAGVGNRGEHLRMTILYLSYVLSSSFPGFCIPNLFSPHLFGASCLPSPLH